MAIEKKNPVYVYENFRYTLYIKFLSKINIQGVMISYLEDQTPDESILLAWLRYYTK